MGRLAGQRCYLSGCMDRVPDGGVGWRREISRFLKDIDVIVLDPTNKPINIATEDFDSIKDRKKWKRAGDFDLLRKVMKEIRHIDMRLTDMADFLIVNLDLTVHACGTYREIFLANDQRKPILIRCEQGKAEVPDWLFGEIEHELFFDTWADIQYYLTAVDGAVEPGLDDMGRWTFFELVNIGNLGK